MECHWLSASPAHKQGTYKDAVKGRREKRANEKLAVKDSEEKRDRKGEGICLSPLSATD